MTSSNFPPNSDFKSEIKSFPKFVLNADAISKRWTIPRRARTSMIAFSSTVGFLLAFLRNEFYCFLPVPKPFMAFLKTAASSLGSNGSAG